MSRTRERMAHKPNRKIWAGTSSALPSRRRELVPDTTSPYAAHPGDARPLQPEMMENAHPGRNQEGEYSYATLPPRAPAHYGGWNPAHAHPWYETYGVPDEAQIRRGMFHPADHSSSSMAGVATPSHAMWSHEWKHSPGPAATPPCARGSWPIQGFQHCESTQYLNSSSTSYVHVSAGPRLETMPPWPQNYHYHDHRQGDGTQGWRYVPRANPGNSAQPLASHAQFAYPSPFPVAQHHQHGYQHGHYMGPMHVAWAEPPDWRRPLVVCYDPPAQALERSFDHASAPSSASIGESAHVAYPSPYSACQHHDHRPHMHAMMREPRVWPSTNSFNPVMNLPRTGGHDFSSSTAPCYDTVQAQQVAKHTQGIARPDRARQAHPQSEAQGTCEISRPLSDSESQPVVLRGDPWEVNDVSAGQARATTEDASACTAAHDDNNSLAAVQEVDDSSPAATQEVFPTLDDASLKAEPPSEYKWFRIDCFKEGHMMSPSSSEQPEAFKGDMAASYSTTPVESAVNSENYERRLREVDIVLEDAVALQSPIVSCVHLSLRTTVVPLQRETAAPCCAGYHCSSARGVTISQVRCYSVFAGRCDAAERRLYRSTSTTKRPVME